jgi:hypothetical protein
VADFMILNAADYGWFFDARIFAGNLDQYLPALQKRLFDGRVFQFLTTRVHTNSRSKANNQMGGCIAIFSYKWEGWILAGYTYTPMGLKSINSLDFKAGDYNISNVNAYISPTSGSYTPHHTRITATNIDRRCHTMSSITPQQLCTQPHSEARWTKDP